MGTAAPREAAMVELREGLGGTMGNAAEADATLSLAEAIRALAATHGAPAVRHCLRMVEELRGFLDARES